MGREGGFKQMGTSPLFLVSDSVPPIAVLLHGVGG